MRAPIRREDRPAHLREAVHEKRRVELDDAVLRLEPRDVPRPTAVLHHAEPDEGAHLVHVVPDRLVHAGERVDIGIDHEGEQLVLAVGQPPQHAVKQRPASRIGVTRHARGDLHELFRHAHAGARGLRRLRLVGEIEQRLVAAELLPENRVGRRFGQ
jgi:hypothetical protein